jgi:hypothetical protein
MITEVIAIGGWDTLAICALFVFTIFMVRRL